MKKFFKVTLWFGLVVFLGVIIRISPYGYLFKGIKNTYLQGEASAHYTDWKGFETRRINSGNGVATKENPSKNKLSEELLQMLNETESGSFLVYKNNELVSENYFNKHEQSSITNSFSMAKTITALLVQKAIQEGYIKSWDENVLNWLPWVQGEFANELTLRHLSTMTAGLKWRENYFAPLGITARAYYSDDVEGVMRSVIVETEPGKKWEYQSGATQFLGMVLMKALQSPPNGLKPYSQISDFASAKLWGPLGMENDAQWSLDHKDGRELTFCCLNASSRDFGKLGLLVLNHGKWNGESIIDSAFLSLASQSWKSINYGHSFWVSPSTEVPFYYYQGLKGQFIVIIPSENMVIVRTGNGVKRKDKEYVFTCLRTYVSEGIRLFGR